MSDRQMSDRPEDESEPTTAEPTTAEPATHETTTPSQPATPETKPRAAWRNREPPTKARLALWVVAGAIGLYYLGSGIFGLLTH